MTLQIGKTLWIVDIYVYQMPNLSDLDELITNTCQKCNPAVTPMYTEMWLLRYLYLSISNIVNRKNTMDCSCICVSNAEIIES